MSDVADGTAIVILAGGEARRFPGKLERAIDGVPMLLRVYRNARQTGWPVYVAAKGSFESGLDAALECPLLIDRRPGGGPLSALVSACESVACERVFALAADEPRVSAALIEAIAAAWQDGDEAVLPEHDGRIEPLAALYARRALLRETPFLFTGASPSMHALLERLQTRRVRVDGSSFVNVNTPGDMIAAGGTL